MRLHTDALLARRTVWESLLHSTVKFNRLADAVERIDQTVKAADRMYMQVSHSVRVCSTLHQRDGPPPTSGQHEGHQRGRWRARSMHQLGLAPTCTYPCHTRAARQTMHSFGSVDHGSGHTHGPGLRPPARMP